GRKEFSIVSTAASTTTRSSAMQSQTSHGFVQSTRDDLKALPHPMACRPIEEVRRILKQPLGSGTHHQQPTAVTIIRYYFNLSVPLTNDFDHGQIAVLDFGVGLFA